MFSLSPLNPERTLYGTLMKLLGVLIFQTHPHPGNETLKSRIRSQATAPSGAKADPEVPLERF